MVKCSGRLLLIHGARIGTSLEVEKPSYGECENPEEHLANPSLSKLSSKVNSMCILGLVRIIVFNFVLTKKLAVGGGTPSSDKNDDQCVWGFGLAIDRDLITGTSSHCATFGSPPLSIIHDASPFEIVNIEVWTTTPCFSLDDAEKLELGKLFLQSN